MGVFRISSFLKQALSWCEVNWSQCFQLTIHDMIPLDRSQTKQSRSKDNISLRIEFGDADQFDETDGVSQSPSTTTRL
jgi:hypothetical protein